MAEIPKMWVHAIEINVNFQISIIKIKDNILMQKFIKNVPVS